MDTNLVLMHMEAYKKSRLDAELKKKEELRIDLSNTVFIWSIPVLNAELKANDTKDACDALVSVGQLKKHGNYSCYHLPLDNPAS